MKLEMPESWTHLRDQIECGLDILPHEGILMLDLLKEMAEAIDKGLSYEDCPPGSCHIYGHDEMRAALKKFKEWE